MSISLCKIFKQIINSVFPSAENKERKAQIDEANRIVGSFNYNYERYVDALDIGYDGVNFINSFDTKRLKSAMFLLMRNDSENNSDLEQAMKFVTQDKLGMFNEETEFKNTIHSFKAHGSFVYDSRVGFW